MTGKISFSIYMTFWWDPRQPSYINVCTSDRRFTDADGGRPGLWIKVRLGRSAFGRIARALRDAGQLHPPIG